MHDNYNNQITDKSAGVYNMKTVVSNLCRRGCSCALANGGGVSSKVDLSS